MRVAVVYNLKSADTEAEAEYDTRDTIRGYTKVLKALQHQVSTINVNTYSAAALINRLKKIQPDVVLNLAEYLQGCDKRTREAVFPFLYKQAGCRFTGSDTWTLAVAQDKILAKYLAASVGAFVPATLYKTSPLTPCVIKPRYEGSSLGVTVVTVPNSIREVRTALDARYPEGVVVEAFIEGWDITVPVLGSEILSPLRILTEHNFYGYAQKCTRAAVHVETVPCPEVESVQLTSLIKRLVQVFQITGPARFDFRYVPDLARCFFLEVNPLPELAWGVYGWNDDLPSGAFAVAARHAGWFYKDLFARVLDEAIR